MDLVPKNAPRRQARWRWLLALAICAAPACGDEAYDVGAPRVDAGAAGFFARDAGSIDAGLERTGDAPTCTHDEDCPPIGGACATSRCNAGRCEISSAPSGTSVADVPPNCRAAICDGAGHAVGEIVSRANVPPAAGPCVVGICDALGRAGMTPLPVGTACVSGPAGAVCDGVGHCVACNRTQDCAPGLYCDVDHHCGAVPCTDLDCGGACPPCDLGLRCLVDADCQSFACDAASARCIVSQCLDHAQDGNETDQDCGGGICKGCALGQACVLDEDCTSVACDAQSRRCISDLCVDHRADGAETDVDCGGPVCAACQAGQKCNTSFDCAAGHGCLQKVCQ